MVDDRVAHGTARARRSTVWVAAVLACAAVAGCGSSESGGDSAPDGTDAEATETEVTAEETATDVSWTLNASEFQGRDGTTVAYDCPDDGEAGPVWGTEIYTDDSSVCTAAVHAGLITIDDGGAVVIEIRPGEDSYEGSEANGITSSEYASWPGSFVFPDAD